MSGSLHKINIGKISVHQIKVMWCNSPKM